MSLPFAILRPVDVPWRPEVDPADVRVAATPADVERLVAGLAGAKLVILDTETRGTDTWKPETEMVGLGLAWVAADDSIHARYVDWRTLSPDLRRVIWTALIRLRVDLIAHNVPFDSAICSMQMDRDFGVPPAWSKENPDPVGFIHRLPFTLCTYGVFRRLASEGWPGQSWSLKAAMVDLLGWTDTNESGIDDWLIAHGWHKVGPKWVDGESPEQHAARVQQWIAEKPEKRATKVRPDKGEMWRCPPAILGTYCILDCLATLDFYERVLRPALDRFPEFEYFHRNAWMDYVFAQCDQQYTGIRVLRHLLVRRRRRLGDVVERTEAELRAHPTLGAAIAEWERAATAAAAAKVAEKEPARTKKLPKLGKEPRRHTRDGRPSASWAKWDAKRRRIAELGEGEVSANWTKWRARLDEALATPKRVNLRSGKALRWLMYETGVISWQPGEAYERGKRRGTIWIRGKFGRVEVERTKSGALPVSRDAVTQFPADLEAPLAKFIKAQKELTYVEAYIDLIHLHPDRTWRIHPGWIAPGTKTDRLSGKKPSLHQVPKSLEFLDCFIPNRGCVWVESDWASAEPYVLAELSRDEALLALYGPDANPNHDRYLFEMAQIPLRLFDGIREHYDVHNPTKEGVATAKSKYKLLRDGGKSCVLADDYGGGAKKKWRALVAKGIQIDLSDVQTLHNWQRRIHAGVEEFAAGLETEWKRRGGWVLNGLGFPMPIYADYLKDRINRVVQSTAHHLHTIYLWIYMSWLRDAGIPVRGIVWDFHDEFICEVPREHARRAIEIANQAIDELNNYIGAYVRMKGGPRECRSLAAAKAEEAFAKREAERAASNETTKGGAA